MFVSSQLTRYQTIYSKRSCTGVDRVDCCSLILASLIEAGAAAGKSQGSFPWHRLSDHVIVINQHWSTSASRFIRYLMNLPCRTGASSGLHMLLTLCSPDVPLDILDTDFCGHFLIVVEPFPFTQIYSSEFCSRLKSRSLPFTLPAFSSAQHPTQRPTYIRLELCEL